MERVEQPSKTTKAKPESKYKDIAIDMAVLAANSVISGLCMAAASNLMTRALTPKQNGNANNENVFALNTPKKVQNG